MMGDFSISMNKFTLFTLFLSSIIVVIVAEIMVNEYLRTPYSLEATANIFQAQHTVQDAGTGTTQAKQSVVVSSGSLSSALLQKAGFQNFTLQAVPYAGKLLDRIAFADLSFIPTFESHLMKNQVARVASFYEFAPGSLQSAGEVYDLIKQKCTGEIGVILNETNSFGEASFYVNYFEFPEKVFLVFRKGTKVFAFTYSKELHEEVGKLIGLL